MLHIMAISLMGCCFADRSCIVTECICMNGTLFVVPQLVPRDIEHGMQKQNHHQFSCWRRRVMHMHLVWRYMSCTAGNRPGPIYPPAISYLQSCAAMLLQAYACLQKHLLHCRYDFAPPAPHDIALPALLVLLFAIPYNLQGNLYDIRHCWQQCVYCCVCMIVYC